MNLQDYFLQPNAPTQKEFAGFIRAHRPDLSRWINGVRKVPWQYCPRIERETSGLIRCEDLRPDIDWAYLRSTAPTLGQGSPGVES